MSKGQYSSRSAMRRARLRDFGYCRVSGFNRRVLMGACGGSTWSFRAPMKRCTVLGLIFCLVGCTTLQPVTYLHYPLRRQAQLRIAAESQLPI